MQFLILLIATCLAISTEVEVGTGCVDTSFTCADEKTAGTLNCAHAYYGKRRCKATCNGACSTCNYCEATTEPECNDFPPSTCNLCEGVMDMDFCNGKKYVIKKYTTFQHSALMGCKYPEEYEYVDICPSGESCRKCNCRYWNKPDSEGMYSDCRPDTAQDPCNGYCVKCESDGTTPMPGFWTKMSAHCDIYERPALSNSGRVNTKNKALALENAQLMRQIEQAISSGESDESDGHDHHHTHDLEDHDEYCKDHPESEHCKDHDHVEAQTYQVPTLKNVDFKHIIRGFAFIGISAVAYSLIKFGCSMNKQYEQILSFEEI